MSEVPLYVSTFAGNPLHLLADVYIAHDLSPGPAQTQPWCGYLGSKGTYGGKVMRRPK